LKYLALLLCVLLTACSLQTKTPQPTNRAAELVAKTVALVDEDGDPYCSGVWVSQYGILTASHCIHSTVSYFITDKDPTYRRPAFLTRIDRSHDLAVLVATSVPSHPVTGISQAVVQGMYVQTMGHSLGLLWSYSSGTVASVREMEVLEDECEWIQASVPMSPGNSGGGLFNEEGQLVGVAYGTLSHPRAQLLNLFVHPKYIAEFLRLSGV
jgi:serine protease Do